MRNRRKLELIDLANVSNYLFVAIHSRYKYIGVLVSDKRDKQTKWKKYRKNKGLTSICMNILFSNISINMSTAAAKIVR